METPDPKQTRSMAREYLDERETALRSSRLPRAQTRNSFRRADHLAALLIEEAAGRAILVDDAVLVPFRSAHGPRLLAFRVWDLDYEADGGDAMAAELAREIAGRVSRPGPTMRLESLARRAREATGCDEEESRAIVAEMERYGFAGDAVAFAELAAAIHERNLNRTPDEAPSDQFPDLAGPDQVLDPRD